MDIGELFPILSGLVLGALFGYGRRFIRVNAAIGLIIPFGALATVATGEIHTSWLFFLLDIPLVAISATTVFLILTLIPITDCSADTAVADSSLTPATTLEPIVVTATRTEMKLQDVRGYRFLYGNQVS
jgi:hypothetical protein